MLSGFGTGPFPAGQGDHTPHRTPSSPTRRPSRTLHSELGLGDRTAHASFPKPPPHPWLGSVLMTVRSPMPPPHPARSWSRRCQTGLLMDPSPGPYSYVCALSVTFPPPQPNLEE